MYLFYFMYHKSVQLSPDISVCWTISERSRIKLRRADQVKLEQLLLSVIFASCVH